MYKKFQNVQSEQCECEVYACVSMYLFIPSRVHLFCKFELVFTPTTMYLLTLKADLILLNVYT